MGWMCWIGWDGMGWDGVIKRGDAGSDGQGCNGLPGETVLMRMPFCARGFTRPIVRELRAPLLAA